jgi:hypothetical protein
MAQLFILSYSDAVSFRDIRGHLGKIPSISNVDTSIELDTIMCTKNKKVWTLGWVNMGNDLTREHVFLPLPTTSWSYFYSPVFRRVTLLYSRLLRQAHI